MDRRTALALARVAAGELEQAMQRIRVPGYPRPYYISYLLRDEERWTLKAKFGALKRDSYDRSRNALADVRVGSYRYDHVRDGGLTDNDKDAESYGYVDLPFGSSHDGVRHGLWRLTDARYREAVEAYLEKRSRQLTYIDANRRMRAFDRGEPKVDLDWRPFPEVDIDAWRGFLERTSAAIRRYPDIKDAQVEFEVDHVCHVFVNSEGSRLIQCASLWSLECYLWLLSDGGDGLPWTIKSTVADPSELPDEAEFRRRIRAAVERLRKLARAPSVRSFCGPGLLMPLPAGLLIHEAVGHRLEGSRLLASGEGQTFKDSVGKAILPPFLSIRDDPRMTEFDGHSLIGHYRYDDEGVEARNTRLVEGGTLLDFMRTRTGNPRGRRSNGHARSAYHQRPISRMGVTVIEAEGGLDERELDRAFLEEIRRQGAPFGIRVIEATGGETATDAYDFQALLGEINLASRVYPDGREEWIRGVNFVGTPLNALGGIVAAGRTLEVDNAFCGAESGYVPVSTISPALVVSQLELQSKPDSPYRPYTLPIPWERR